MPRLQLLEKDLMHLVCIPLKQLVEYPLAYQLLHALEVLLEGILVAS